MVHTNFRECQNSLFYRTILTETNYTEKQKHIKYSAGVQLNSHQALVMLVVSVQINIVSAQNS